MTLRKNITEVRAEEMLYGVLLEHCLTYHDTVPECPECKEGWWIPVGFFTTQAKYEEWMMECGYEKLPPEYRTSEVPIDEGPLNVTSTLFSPDTGVSYTTNIKDTNWIPRGEEE